VTAPFRLIPLGKEDRSGFDCGNDILNRYFHRQAGQDMRRRLAACYIAVEGETGLVAGFYTLSAADVPVGDVPENLTKKLPYYPTIPVARVGRLAIDRRFQGRGLGGAMLFNAAKRVADSGLGALALVVDAKDDAAVRFYLHHGFRQYGENPMTLMQPLASMLAR